MRTIVLTNLKRRMQVFVLPHELLCEPSGTCFCVAAGERKLPWSLTIPALGKARHLPESILNAPDVARALKAGELKVRREPIKKETSQTTKSKRRSRKKKSTTPEAATPEVTNG